MSVVPRKIVAVAGPGEATEEEARIAEEVGAGIARLGAVLVTGGRGGVMEAACRGAASAGGETLGILPGLDRSEANRFLTLSLPTGLGDLRNLLVARSGRVLVAIGGRLGTLSEIALALKSSVPVVGIRCPAIEPRTLGGRPGIRRVETAREALEVVREILDQG